MLSTIGARMRTALRSSDVKCRYGGDEFMVILPETPIVGARQVCETLRRANDPLAVIARTDAALYLSKQDGRYRVTATELDAVPA